MAYDGTLKFDTAIDQKGFDKGLKDIETSATKVGKALAPISIAAGAALGVSVKNALSFSEAMAKVGTIADTTQVPIDDLRKQILKLSNDTGIAAELIADDVYNAISAGQSTGDAVVFVEQASKLARAGFLESAGAIDILTTALNAYQLSSEESARISDVLLNTQNRGKVTVAELADNMGRVIPTAKANNVEFEQLGASYEILTKNGIKAAEATTYLNAMFNELGKTGTNADKMLKEISGKSFAQLTAEGKSVGDILTILDGAAKSSGISLSDLFGSAEAGRAALVLLSGGADGFNESLKSMQESAGTTQKAFEAMDTPMQTIKEAFNKIKNAGIEIGEALLPIIALFAEGFANLVGVLDMLGPVGDLIIGIFLTLVAVVSPLLLLIGNLAGAFVSIKTAMLLFAPVATTTGAAASGALLLTGTSASTAAGGVGLLSAAMNSALIPIGLVVVAVGGIILLFAELWKTSESFRNFWIEVWQKIKEAPQKVMTDLKNDLAQWKEIGEKIATGIFDGIKAGWQAIENWINDKFGWLDKKLDSWGLGGGTTKAQDAGLKPRVSGTYATGMGNVSKDMTLTVHRGEEIVPANKANADTQLLQQVVSELRELKRVTYNQPYVQRNILRTEGGR